jgi:hypothetical protein
LLAVRQTDIKQVLAYTTLMALGALTLFIGAGSADAIKAAMMFLVVHSLYKAALFLMIGLVDHETGTREVDKLRGLARAMPVTFVAGALAAISMAGIPPFFGFIGKELKYAGALAVASEPVLVAGAVLVASALMLAVAGRGRDPAVLVAAGRRVPARAPAGALADAGGPGDPGRGGGGLWHLSRFPRTRAGGADGCRAAGFGGRGQAAGAVGGRQPAADPVGGNHRAGRDDLCLQAAAACPSRPGRGSAAQFRCRLGPVPGRA